LRFENINENVARIYVRSKYDILRIKLSVKLLLSALCPGYILEEGVTTAFTKHA